MQKSLKDMSDVELLAYRKEVVGQIAAYNNQQMVRKVNLNSAYGSIGSNYFRFYDTDMAEAVTITGQYVIRRVANRVNAFLNRTFNTDDDYIIASDTDSIYVRLDRVVHRYTHETGITDTQKMTSFLDRFCELRVQKVIDSAFAEIAEYLNVYEPCLSMKREVIADKGVWTAKKRYVLNCLDTEGVRHHEPKLKVMGLEVVKSSTPAICRDMMMHVLTLMLRQTQEDIWSYVAEQRRVFDAAKFEDVAFPRSANSLSKYSEQDKSLPIAVRGALVYNTHIVHLQGNYERIRAGQKVKFAYLRVPNRFQSNVISAPDGCPDEWCIETLLDYETQWQKAFVEPMQAVLTCIGWSVEKQDVLF